MRAPLKTALASWAPCIKILLLLLVVVVVVVVLLLLLLLSLLFFLHLLYIGLFLFSNEGRGVSFVTDGIVDSVLMN